MKLHLKLSTKLLFSFGAVAAVALAIGAAGYYGAAKNQKAMNETGTVHMPSVNSLLTVKSSLERIRSICQTLARPDISDERREQGYKDLATSREQYHEALKTYRGLPKSPQQTAAFGEFETALTKWRDLNDKALQLSKQFEELGIFDSDTVASDLQNFMIDHYKLSGKVSDYLRDPKLTSEGGEDSTACRLGKWFTTFQTKNPTLLENLKLLRDSHDRFHTSVAKVHQLAAAGKHDEAGQAYDRELRTAMSETLSILDRSNKVVAEAVGIDNSMRDLVQGPVREAQEACITILDKLVAMNRSEALAAVDESQKEGQIMKILCLGAMILGTAVAGVLGILVTRSITRPIHKITDQLSSGASEASAAAQQVSNASQGLAAGASEQAAAVEETSSSLEELSSMTKRNEENATKANDLAKQARAAAEKGAHDMQAMNGAMQAIKSSSDEVAKIIKTIDEIAFQTNILALNAAVEAARAGEAGLGFAVVADEVRNLAQRAAQAAKDTAAKIEGSISNTAQGVEISSKVSVTLNEIVIKAREVDTLAAEVASASHEQSQGITQINSAVGQMDKVVQTNAASAEESSAAAEQLTAQAVMVRESVEELLALVNGADVKGSHMQSPVTPTSEPVAEESQTLMQRRIVAKNPSPAQPASTVRPHVNGARSRVESAELSFRDI